MHPNVYLRTFWGMDMRPEIFVAMSFADKFKQRYEEVIAPAISSITIGGNRLVPKRVDLSKSGDSILSEIMDGIAHSQIVLADVSTVGVDKSDGRQYRNANVMYEVGLALACRHPSEVLLVRDDRYDFLFDVSTIPHKTIDFTTADAARAELTSLLLDRLKERKFVQDARVKTVAASLSAVEFALLKQFLLLPRDTPFGLQNPRVFDTALTVGFPKLLDKKIIRLVATLSEGDPLYYWTEYGIQVAQEAINNLPVFQGGFAQKSSTVSPDVEVGKQPETADEDRALQRPLEG